MPRHPPHRPLAEVLVRARRGRSGQASVELVALLPLLIVVGALVLQGAIAGGAAWFAGAAAREAARAQAIGADPLRAARTALPGGMARSARVRVTAGDRVEVRIQVPSLLGVDLGAVTSRAHLEAQR